MSAEWAIFAAVVAIGVLMWDRVNAVIDRLEGIRGLLSEAKHQWDEDAGRHHPPGLR